MCTRISEGALHRATPSPIHSSTPSWPRRAAARTGHPEDALCASKGAGLLRRSCASCDMPLRASGWPVRAAARRGHDGLFVTISGAPFIGQLPPPRMRAGTPSLREGETRLCFSPSLAREYPRGTRGGGSWLGICRSLSAGCHSFNSHHTGTWSDGLSCPLILRSMPAAVRRSAAWGERRRWSMRMPWSLLQAPAW